MLKCFFYDLVQTVDFIEVIKCIATVTVLLFLITRLIQYFNLQV